MSSVVQMLWFLLPAAASNLVPPLLRKSTFLKSLARPIDGGATWRGKPVLGPHKTWRGLVSGTIAGIAVAGLQAAFGPTQLAIVDYSYWPLIGAMLGAGALIGDAIKSFFKRRVGVASGSPWVPFDQVDFGIGAVLFGLPFVQPGWPAAMATIGIYAIGHTLIVHIGYWLRLRRERW